MRWDVALYDLVAPYILRGAPLGPIHAAISVLHVQDYDDATSAEAVVIRGMAQFRGETGAFIDPQTMTFGVNAQNVEGHPRDDDGDRNPWIDLRDSNVRFELTAPRTASQIAVAAANTLDPVADTDILDLLDALDSTPDATTPSDYVSTEFTLDMVVTSAVLRFPFLKGAELLPDGRLVPIAGDDRVEIFLPRFKLRLVQGSDAAQPLDISMTSFGVEGLDDPADLGVVDLVRMEPPYAFLGSSHTVGIGFRGATLDLSRQSTPPEILDQFGFGESWTGLHFPELRLFVAPNGLEDFAVSASAENLLIGWGAEPGVTGDFGVAVINQGDGALRVSARFVDAGGTLYGITRTGDATAVAQIPVTATLVVDVEGGRAPYQVTVDGVAGRVHSVDLGAEREQVLRIEIDDASAPVKGAVLEITATPYRKQINVTPGRIGGVEIVNQQSLRDGQPVAQPQMYIVSQSNTSVTLGLRGAAGSASWSEGTVVDGKTKFDIAEGEQTDIVATLFQTGTSIDPMTAYFRFDRPEPYANDFAGYVGNADNSRTTPAVNQGPDAGWTGGGTSVMGTFASTFAALPPATMITIEGTASFETDSPDKRVYNHDLSRLRAEAFQMMISNAFQDRFEFTILPSVLTTEQPPLPWVNAWKLNDEDRNTHWQATVTVPDAAVPDIVTTATLRRTETVPTVIQDVLDVPPDEPEPPDWFRSIALKVRIVKNSFVAVELSGAVDFATAAEDRLQAGSVMGPAPPGGRPEIEPGALVNNSSDGIVDYRILVQVDDAAQVWTVSAALGADPADVNGLALLGAGINEVMATPSPALNMLGMTTVMAPVLATTAPDNPLDGDVGALLLSGAALAIPNVLAALDWLTVQRVILYGGELLVRDRPSGTEVNFLFDVQTDVSVDIRIGANFPILTIPDTNPLKIRYKAIGQRMGYTPETGDRFQFRPVFDSSKGYTISVDGPGGLQVADPLGRVLKVLAARLARQNPMTFEIDLGFSVDLGVISVDRARVRLPIHEAGPPELTAMAATIDIPAVLRASGYLEIGSTENDDGVEIGEVRGGLDLTIVPIKLRIKAEIAVASIPADAGGPATGVVVSIEVTFPAPIPLGSSGLGLLGVLGLFAMHYGRNKDPYKEASTPALAWLEATGGNPTRLSSDDGSEDFWTPQIGNWAFGVGAVLGTAEGGVIFNLKGVFLLEIPGPRILMMMKAAMLTPPPAVEGLDEAGGSLLAVIDLDAGRGTLTIGIVAEYGADPLVKVRIPVEAFFDLNERKKWHIYLGRYDDPIHANVIMVFEGSGYFMISGNGIDLPGDSPPAISGRLAIALGMHVELIWGSKEVRIYASVAGGFEALMGFDPFYLQGKLEFRGELRLIIISISASAGLDVFLGEDPATGQDVARLEGEIRGKVDLFFFSIEGSVDFGMGQLPSPQVPPLVEKMNAVSRSPALVRGTGVDTPIDAVLSTAIMQDSAPAASEFVEPELAEDDDPRPRRIPIDAVLSLSLTAAPRGSTFQLLGRDFNDTAPGSKADGFTDRGTSKVFYELTEVALVEGALTEGTIPATWWETQTAPDTPELTQLALLTWTPYPFSAAIERSEFLNQIVTDRWGTICDDAAPAAAVLWAFHREPIGPSAIGWTMRGTVWPDPVESQRSENADADAEVFEAWRSGHSSDVWRGILPGVILGASVKCVDVPDRPTGPGDFVGRDAVFVPPINLAPDFAVVPPARRPVGLSGEAETLAFAADMATFVGRSARRTTARVTPPDARPADILNRLRQGAAIDHAAFDVLQGRAETTAAEIPQDGRGLCDSRILSAPEFDDTEPVTPMGDATRTEDIVKGWEEVGFEPSALGCAIRIRSGGIAEARLLLASHEAVLQRKALIVRVLDAQGAEISRETVRMTQAVPPTDLPDRWTDTNGPWFEDVEHAIRFDPSFVSPNDQMHLLLIDLPEAQGAEMIEIGIDYSRLLRSADGAGANSAHPLPGLGVAVTASLAAVPNRLTRFFYVLCFELTRMGEVQRAEYDEQLIESDRGSVGRYLDQDPGEIALLMPDTRYGLRVSWVQNEEGADPTPEDETFWFHTTAEPPTRLGPYMLFTLPNERETHVFGREPLTLVFSSPQVINLFAAHGLDLEIRLRAASFRQPGADDLAEGETYPFPITPETTSPLGPIVLTPLEETVAEVLDGQCIEIDENRTRHLLRTIDGMLDPLTDYILDIVGVPQGGADIVGDRILHSVSFSTGAYPTLERFARVLKSQRGNDRWVETGAMAQVAATFAGDRQPEGAELDSAMIDAGLEAMPTPDRPETTVFWEQSDPDAVPQPVAILIDAPEPMRRFWSLPVKRVDDETEPPSEYWDNQPLVWLDLREGADTPGTITKILRDPGGQRALVILAPGARGVQVQVDMVRFARVEELADAPDTDDRRFAIVDLILNQAPWEE